MPWRRYGICFLFAGQNVGASLFYFKIMEDGDLKQKLLETGDEPLIYVSDDEENLFGRALMELRDEIRRICKNEDLIDWEYTEYLKYKPWY